MIPVSVTSKIRHITEYTIEETIYIKLFIFLWITVLLLGKKIKEYKNIQKKSTKRNQIIQKGSNQVK